MHRFNAVFRNYSGMGPMLEMLEHAGVWKQFDLEPGEFAHEHSAARAEDRLIAGEIDFIFGNHVSVYIRLAEGYPIVCLAEQKNYDHSACVSAEPIQDLRELEGKRVGAGELLDEQGRFFSHPRADISLYLKRAGAREDRIDFVPAPADESKACELVKTGDADATFVISPAERLGARMGLHVLPLQPLPMAFGATITTLTTNVRKNPDFFERLIKAEMMAIHLFRSQREKTIEILNRTFSQKMGYDAEMVEATYELNYRAMNPTLYPEPESIMNAFELAKMVAAEKVREVIPTALWDLHHLRQVHESGFYKELTAGRVLAGIPS